MAEKKNILLISSHEMNPCIIHAMEQDGYTVLNARVGLEGRDRRWAIELWAQNLTDEEYVQVGFDAPLQNVSPLPGNPFNSYNAFLGAPRTYGATFRVRY